MAPYAAPTLLYGTGAGYVGSMAGLSEEMMPDLAEAALYHKTSQVSGLGAAVTVIAGGEGGTHSIPNAEELKMSQTVQKHMNDIVKRGSNAGQLSRLFIDSNGTTLLLNEIMESSTPASDTVL